ncbi:MAG: response regulator [Oscillospiraceae bacterium]|nr:response regulator [Oscillospiraceae bacterium]
MFKLLIVESEYADYQYLKGLVNLEKLGVDEIEYCDNGTAALERILCDCPNLVFTDIQLPGMDGIELIRRCRDAGISCSFVVVSRWRRFEYVQSVMRLGAEDYLVKPVDAGDLVRVVSTLVERQRAEEARELSEKLFVTRRLLRNSFMAAFTAPDARGPYSLEELNKTYHFSLRPGVFRSAIIALHGLPESENGIFLPALAQSLRARFDPLCYEMIPYIRGEERLILTFNYDPNGGATSHFSDLLEIVQEHLQKRDCSRASFSIGLGAPETDIAALHRTLETAERAVRCRLLRGQNQLFDYAAMKFDAVKGEDVLTPTLISELRSGAELLDATAFQSAVNSAFASISRFTDPAVILDLLHAAADAVYSVCTESGYAAVTREGRNAILESLQSELTLSGTRDALCRWAAEQFEACKYERQNSRPVRAAQRYIQEHYMEPLTLEQIAGRVHLNASYFSIIFKKQTGQNFSDFLTACRIDAAKQLLRETDMPVSAVCEAVGYLDRKYFSRTFMKLVGIKPSAYRTLHG